MKSNEEFKSEVYERFEQYKAKKAQQRRNFIKYGSITLSAFVVAIAVAAPVFRSTLSKSQSASYNDDINNSINAAEIEEGHKSLDNIGGNTTYGSGETMSTYERFDFSINPTSVTPTNESTRENDATGDPPVVTTAAATVSSTQAATTTVSTGTVTVNPRFPVELVDIDDEYISSPNITVRGADNIGDGFLGIKTFSNKNELFTAINSEYENEGDVSVGVYYSSTRTLDYEIGEIRACCALVGTGKFHIKGTYDDGETLRIDVVFEKYRYRIMDIYVVGGDRAIVFNILGYQESEEGVK